MQDACKQSCPRRTNEGARLVGVVDHALTRHSNMHTTSQEELEGASTSAPTGTSRHMGSTGRIHCEPPRSICMERLNEVASAQAEAPGAEAPRVARPPPVLCRSMHTGGGVRLFRGAGGVSCGDAVLSTDATQRHARSGVLFIALAQTHTPDLIHTIQSVPA